MDPIAWEMQYGLPNQTYLQFVARYLLPSGQQGGDPFALDVPTEQACDICYVGRDAVEREIGRPDTTRIILGREGSGKSTLFRKLPEWLGDAHTLVVQIPLAQAGIPVAEEKLMEGRFSVLTPDLLTRLIFDAYWEDFLRKNVKRELFLPNLRRDRWWMTQLRWFYRNSPPQHPDISQEFELMTWLKSEPSVEPFGSSLAPGEILRALVRFVTSERTHSIRPVGVPAQAYTHILVLMDETEHLSNPALARLIRDTQHLYDLQLGAVQFKLFTDLAVHEVITQTMACVRQGRVAVYCLPQWSEEKLNELLLNRLRRFDPITPEAYTWGRLIPTEYLRYPAQTSLVSAIVKGAMRTYDKKDDLDAPIHALRLARGLVAACAGCWKNQEYQPPLSTRHLAALVDTYWQEERNGGLSEPRS